MSSQQSIYFSLLSSHRQQTQKRNTDLLWQPINHAIGQTSQLCMEQFCAVTRDVFVCCTATEKKKTTKHAAASNMNDLISDRNQAATLGAFCFHLYPTSQSDACSHNAIPSLLDIVSSVHHCDSFSSCVCVCARTCTVRKCNIATIRYMNSHSS